MLGNGLSVGIHIEPRMRLLPMYAFLVILLTPHDANAAYLIIFSTDLYSLLVRIIHLIIVIIGHGNQTLFTIGSNEIFSTLEEIM
jgi:hypothetical protein